MRKILILLASCVLFSFYCVGFCYADEISVPEKPNIENLSVEEANQLITEYNNQVDIYNQQIDKNYQNEIEKIDLHNQQVEQQYATDQEQYNSDYAQYEKDKAFEDRIIADPRYDNIEQYNAAVTNYNNQVERYNTSVTTYNESVGVTNEIAISSVEQNQNTPAVNINDTYTITPGQTQSEHSIPVHLEHNFVGTNVSYSTDFYINSNDIITFTGIAPLTKVPVETLCLFFYNTDNAHQLGVWSNSWSYLACDGEHIQDWNCGDTHTVSFDSNKSYVWQFAQIKMIYNYLWIPLYKPYDYAEYANVPVKPEESVMGELLSYPVKPTHLPYMDLIVAKEVSKNNIETEIIDNDTPQAAGMIRSLIPQAYAEEIVDDGVPLYSTGPNAADHWALLNLILMFVSIMMLIRFRQRKNDEHQYKRRGNLLTVICAGLGVILFIVTENIYAPMVFVDEYTLYHVILTLGAIGTRVASKDKEVEAK